MENLRTLLNSFFNNNETKNVILSCKNNDEIFKIDLNSTDNIKYIFKDKIIINKVISYDNVKYLQKLDKICREVGRNKIENKIEEYLKSCRQKMDIITEADKFDVCYKRTCEIRNFIPFFCMIVIYDDIMEEFLNYINYSLSYDELKSLTDKLITIQTLRNKYEHRTCADIPDSWHIKNTKKVRKLTFDILNLLVKFPLVKS